MRDKNSSPDDFDLSRTDELPVLAEDAVVTLRGKSLESDDSDPADTSRQRTLRVETPDRSPSAPQEPSSARMLEEALKTVLHELDERRTSEARLEKALEQRGAEVADLQAEVARLRDELAEAHARRQRADAELEKLTALQHEVGERPAAPAVAQVTALPAEGTNPRPVAGPGNDAAPLAVLIRLASKKPERHIVSAPETLIGRGAACAIRIVTHSVSREHARLKHENGKVIIHDCGSRNGVFVNSVRVKRHELEHGDSITIGDAHFRFLLEGAQT